MFKKWTRVWTGSEFDGQPIFLWERNSLVAVGCNSKASLTNIEPAKLDCELNCTATLPTKSVRFRQHGCSSNGLSYAYRSRLPDDAEAQQVIGVRIESFDQETLQLEDAGSLS
ncbi:hypothetical protein Bca52824_014443 [Brassica carinata]|uniref:Uncharacterized protein n=1 Tax=Brassica carinata TaxID=52824 RepID=A0A8X7W2F3_BRACI|nr:hypothetical protein Bca52824_014443 [Brassica carinata]